MYINIPCHMTNMAAIARNHIVKKLQKATLEPVD